MPAFTVNATRFDPYKNFRFRVVVDGRVVAGVSHVTALTRTTEVVEHRAGTDLSASRRSPGRTHYEPITLERGVTHDAAFEAWASLVHEPDDSVEVSLGNFRKDIALELMNEAGQVVLRYVLWRCWPSRFVALPQLDANGHAEIAIQSLTLEVESWSRDRAVVEPAEPSRGGGDE